MPAKNHSASHFAQAICAVVRSIKPGTTMSYQEVAVAAGYNKAARAVGTVMRKNFDTRIPCHRVINSDGTLGAYNRGGETAKRKLLIAEGWQPPTV